MITASWSLLLILVVAALVIKFYPSRHEDDHHKDLVGCTHDFELVSDPWTTTAETAWFKCRKCGHEEGL